MSTNNYTKTSKNTRRTHLFFTGLTMGLADLVPGVSGGTIAFLFGIYDELLYTIKLITGKVPKLILKGKFSEAFRIIPFSFLLPLGIGIALAIFGLVHIVSYFLDTQPTLVWALFFGLVLGSAYMVSRRITSWTLNQRLLLLLGFVITFIIVGLPSTSGNDSPLALFATGVVAITAMILPGISGSLIMVLLGQYEIVISAVSDRDFLALGVFAAGAILGLALFVRVLTWLLKHYHFAVIAFLVGVMLGSLRRIWPWQTTDTNDLATNTIPAAEPGLLFVLLVMVLGFVIVFALERIGITKEHNDINTREFKKDFTEIEGK
jgi:putative membrane protein